MAIFPGVPRLAGTRISPFWILLVLRMMEVLPLYYIVSQMKLLYIEHCQLILIRLLFCLLQATLVFV